MHERGRPRQDAAARRSVDISRPQQSFDRGYEGSPPPQGNPVIMHASAAFMPGASAGSPRSALVITGADLAIQPFPQLQTGPALPYQSAALEPEGKPPAQEGPLTYYPSYSTVDPQHKWQRIRDWASQDSVTALGPAAPASAHADQTHISAGLAGPSTGGDVHAAMAADSPNPLPSGAGGAGSDSSASIDSTLLEMELERARASLRVATAGAPGRLSAEGSLGRLFGGASAIFGGQPAPGPGPRPGLAASREPSFAGLGPVPSTSKLASQPPGQHVSSRADTFQAGLGAIGEVSALLNTSLAGPVPATGAHGAAAAGRTGAVGSVGISGFVHSMQHAHAAFSVERAALEARCRAAEEALSAAERRHAATLEPLQSRVTTLESSMAAERQLCGQLQQQLQVELQRLRTATEAETAARAAEAAAREMLAASGQSLEMERRRADEAAAKAAVAARDFTSRIAGLEEERSGLAKQLKQEKEHASALHKQLREAQRQEQALLEKLGTSEGARQQQEMRLEAAAEQVSAMRSELQLLNAKLAARDKQLLQHVKDMEETQLAALRTELAAAQSRTQASEAAYSQLRGALAAVHSALGPQALAAAFGYSEQLLSGLSAGAAEYGSLADRLMAARVVAEEDGKAVVTRVKELVAMTRNLYMTAERREVALSTEMDSAMAALRQTNTDAEARLASCNTALRATAQRVEELTNHLQESRGRCGELDTAVQAARLALDVELRSGEGLRATVSELQAEVSRLRARVADAEGAERELSSSRDQVAQLQALTAALQAQVEQLGGLAERSGQAVETKDERIRELRTALAAAMDGASKAESQGNALLREKQEVADALEAERRRSADLESVVKASEQELERVRTEADNVEGVFAQLSQQVVEAARLAAAQAREMQQGGIGSDNNRDAAVHTSPMLLYATTEHLERASEDAASQLTALEAYLATRGYKSPGWQQRPGTASSRSGPWYDSAGRQGTHGQVAAEALVLADEIHEAPKLCVQALLACVRQVKTQQALTHQQLITAQQHLRSLLPEGSGMHTPTASGRSAGRALSAPSKSGASGQQPHNDAAQALPVHELAVAVAASADAARQVVTEATEATMKAEKQCESLASRLKKLEKELAQTQQTAAEAAQLKEKLASAEAELQHVKAAAQAEFGRVQNEVSKAFQVAEQVRGEIMAEADNRVRAVERAAAETTSRAESQAAAAIAALEARLREAEAARSDALSRADARIAAAEQATAAQSASTASLMASLQEEVNKARSLLDTAEADLRALRAERAAGLQHVTRLDEQLRRAAEEAARWRKSAAPRIRDRMVMLAKLRVLRRKRADLVERLAAERQRGAQLGAAAEARRLKLQQGAAQLRQLQIDNVHLSSRLQEAESRAARADALLPRMEDRRIALEQDRKAQAEKVAKLSGQLAEATKAAEAARKAEAAARKELDRVLREQLEPQQRRSATMLEELERAAAALQESQANATRLLQQGESLRAEVEELQHMLEQERDQAQEQLLAAARDVTERDALIADMRRQLAVAQAAAAAAAALLPAVQSGQLGDATAVQAHLIGQVGQLQAANVELEARRAAVEAELEVLRVRIGRAEAAGVARPATAITAHSMHTVYPAPQSGQAQVLALDSLGVRSLAGIGFHDAAAGRDDGTASIAGSYTRNDAAGNDVIAAKDQRIHELRAALASVMADRTVAQKEAATAREEAVRATTASAEAAARAAAEAETQSTRIRELQAEVEQAAANVNALQAALQEREQRHTAALEDLQLQLRRAIEVAEAQRAEELTAAHAEAAAQAEAREAWWRKELEGLEAREREAASQAEAHLRSEMGAADARSRADAEARETRWREEEARWKEDARAAEDRWREDMAALDLRSREALDAAERAAKQQLEDVRAQAQQQITALEQRLRAEASASDKRVRDAERAAAEAVARADERTRQAERAREQLSQMQTLHASAEEAVKQLTAQLRELQAGGSSAAQMAVAEAAALSATVDTLRREATLAKDTIDAHEQEVKRLRAQHETAAALGRTLTSQLQGLSEDLASARTRIGVLQTELAAQQAELDTLRQTNETLKASLAAAEDRHLDSEAQLVEAEQSLSRQQGLVRQVQSENERLHEQYKELQQQLQKLTQERRSALIASAAAAATTPLTAREGAASPATGSPTRSRAATAAATPGTAGWLGAASAARTPAASIAVSARGRQVAAALLAAAGSPGAESLGRAAAAVAGDLERQLLEATVGEMQTKLDALQADLFAAEARASQAEHNAQLLRMDLQAAETRVRAADGKVADLQAQLQAAAAGTAEDVGALRQHVLDLELQLEAQRDREQATQEAVARASARCEELQQQAVAAERRVEELAHACEDRDLEVGVLRAQLASASADRLVEGLQGQSQQASHVQSALELQARQQAILVDSLQAELQAILSRAEAADKALTDTRTAVDTLRAEAADAARQRDKAVAEANAAVETLARLRADSSKFAGRLSALEAELLETQAARDRAAAQIRAAEAQAEEERTEVRSLRRQLQALAEASQNSRSEGGAAVLQRVADLESALAAARQQARDAEDAVLEAAAAQVRASALETRTRELEVALTDAETRLAAALEAETRAAGSLVAQHEAARQEAQELQLQLRAAADKLALSQQQVQDRDVRLEGYAGQVASMSKQTEVLEAQLREVRQHLRAAMQERDEYRKQATASSLELEYSEGARTARHNDDTSSVDGGAPQLVGMLTENRDLLDKITTMHNKLKLARAKIAQLEHAVRSCDAEVAVRRAEAAAASTGPGKLASSAVHNSGPLVDALRAELQAYKDALRLAQDEAAASAAVATEAQARCEALTQRLAQERGQHTARSQAGSRTEEAHTPSTHQRVVSSRTGEDDGGSDGLLQRVRAQRAEIESLQTELQSANTKRTELARQAAALGQRVAESEMRERELSSEGEMIRQQLSLAQQQLSSRQALLDQLTSQHKQQLGSRAGPGSPGGPSWSQDSGAAGFLATVSASPGSQAVSSQQQLVSAQQSAQQASKLDRVVAMWRDACRAKDARMQEMQADLATFGAQLEKARAEVSSLTAQVLEREQALGAVARQLDLTRDSLDAQLLAAEEKLAAKSRKLSQVEDELQQRDQDLHSARAQLQATQRSLVALQDESDGHRESAHASASQLAMAQQQVQHLQAELQQLQRDSSVAAQRAHETAGQVQPLQEQMARADAQVAQVVAMLRGALAASGAANTEGLALVTAGNLPTSLRMLEELVSVLVEELQRRTKAASEVESAAAALQSQLAARQDDIGRLEARLKASQDGLAARLDELSRLQTALRRKEADCEAVEAEIAAQIGDYQRLKQRLLQQERDSSRLSADQEAMLRRSDELEGALAAKQEECALLNKKCAQLEEQWQAGRAALAALQERVRSLDAQSEVLQRSNKTSALARQDAAASLDAARSEVRAVAQQAATYREQLEQRNNEVRELNSMLQAWEAMRLGKDAQIAALLERCKRHEEDAAEKARTVEALRRKLQAFGAAPSGRPSMGAAAATGSPNSSSYGTPLVPAAHDLAAPDTQRSVQSTQSRSAGAGGGGSMGARHIHVHMHGPIGAPAMSPAVSGTGSTMAGHRA